MSEMKRFVQGDNRTQSFLLGLCQFRALGISPSRLKVSAAVTPGTITNGNAYRPATQTITGAALGDQVMATYNEPLLCVTLTARDSAANTVAACFQNGAAASADCWYAE